MSIVAIRFTKTRFPLAKRRPLGGRIVDWHTRPRIAKINNLFRLNSSISSSSNKVFLFGTRRLPGTMDLFWRFDGVSFALILRFGPSLVLTQSDGTYQVDDWEKCTCVFALSIRKHRLYKKVSWLKCALQTTLSCSVDDLLILPADLAC